ncbi:Gfo/Idh/MocA family oxidoreductase [Chelativorans sp. SCAU2101]|uniref:Gfo/Idh/MocA family oxidoreductase n=1 Tax=Chelativorans petroleitrophicus TaxID=2975484 RepID=A0A9X2X817_9HYPH|nr:Gfo/Idh/MocA family oxidoreductase [Chelativorans petroleitrophicus]MCT8990159.1 Gfo/Idh/MocA family oxidoreductase [Chelativorans petroleitrophicus]
MARKLGVGVIGCGNISAAYMRLAPHFRGIEMRACADVNPDAAKARAEEFGLRQESVDGLLAADDIDIVVNLTIPAAHYEISKRGIDAGKHVYSEKPFVLSVEEGKALAALAKEKGVRLGSAPDTFLGGAHQLARHLIDSGAIGKVVSGTCHVMSHGMEHWHPNPDFFFKPGAGPVLDVGPYYVTNLIQLVGPVKRVCALASTPTKERTILSEPRRGQKIIVETPTTIHAVMEFENGAVITLGASWDVWHHRHGNMELYGETGSLHVPDPNFFGGEVILTREAEIADLPRWEHPLSVTNQEGRDGKGLANYRTAGLADMALAILEGRPHRCSLEMSLHAVDVMTSILKSAETGSFVELTTTCERPSPLDVEAARGLLAEEKVPA